MSGILTTIGKVVSLVPAPVLEALSHVVEHAIDHKVERNPEARIAKLRKARADADARDANGRR